MISQQFRFIEYSVAYSTGVLSAEYSVHLSFVSLQICVVCVRFFQADVAFIWLLAGMHSLMEAQRRFGTIRFLANTARRQILLLVYQHVFV